MPQINNGKSPPWVSGEIVTAAGLNGMIDSATLDPSAITAQSNLATLTGDEYSLIVDTAGLLKKTQLKNIGDAGTDIKTDNIFGSTINGTLIIQPNGTTSSLNLQGGSAGVAGAISLNAKDVSITASASFDSSGTFTVVSGTGGTTFTSGGTTLFDSKVLFNVTSSVGLPVGTTAQRPATPATGDFRFNSTTTDAEVYNGSAWESFNPVESSALTANGFIKLTNGLILQWGTSAVGMANYSEQTINFPTAFATACFSVQITAKTATVMTSGAAGYENGIKLNGNPTTTSFSVYCNWAGSLAGGIVYPTWFAIGI